MQETEEGTHPPGKNMNFCWIQPRRAGIEIERLKL
jgi:hypothetical protein